MKLDLEMSAIAITHNETVVAAFSLASLSWACLETFSCFRVAVRQTRFSEWRDIGSVSEVIARGYDAYQAEVYSKQEPTHA